MDHSEADPGFFFSSFGVWRDCPSGARLGGNCHLCGPFRSRSRIFFFFFRRVERLSQRSPFRRKLSLVWTIQKPIQDFFFFFRRVERLSQRSPFRRKLSLVWTIRKPIQDFFFFFWCVERLSQRSPFRRKLSLAVDHSEADPGFFFSSFGVWRDCPSGARLGGNCHLCGPFGSRSRIFFFFFRCVERLSQRSPFRRKLSLVWTIQKPIQDFFFLLSACGEIVPAEPV